MKDADITSALGVGQSTVERIRKRCVEEGVESALNRKKQLRRRQKGLDGEGEARLIAMVSRAERGYDAQSNYRDIVRRGSVPVIAIRRPHHGLRDGTHTREGAPVCMGMVEMRYVKSDPERGHLFECRPQGCRLKYRRGVRYCDSREWEYHPGRSARVRSAPPTQPLVGRTIQPPTAHRGSVQVIKAKPPPRGPLLGASRGSVSMRPCRF